MEKFAIDLDRVLDEFELNEGQFASALYLNYILMFISYRIENEGFVFPKIILHCFLRPFGGISLWKRLWIRDIGSGIAS